MSKSIKDKLKKVLDKGFLTPLKYVIPVKKVVLFESFSDFCDSSKTVYEEMFNDPFFDDYKFVWFVDNPDKFEGDKHRRTSFIKINFSGLRKIYEEIRNFYLMSSSKYFFYTHRSFARTAPKYNQKFINLTHGTSLKDTKGIHPPFHLNSITTVTSEFTKELRVKSYGGGREQMVITGLPRNDYLFAGLNNSSKNKLNLDCYYKLIFWMPTFRRQKGKERNDTGTSKTSDIPLLDDSNDWKDLNALLDQKNMLMIVKPHPAQRLEFIKEVNLSHIQFIKNEQLEEYQIDLYKLLGESDALISDYSSIFIDYLLLDKPIGFTVDDMAAYQENLGFSVSDPLVYMPGEKLATKEELKSFISSLSEEQDDYYKERKKIINKFHYYKEPGFTQRVINITKM